MKLHFMELFFGKKEIIQSHLKLVILSSLALLLITVLPYYSNPLIQTQCIASLPLPPILHANNSSLDPSPLTNTNLQIDSQTPPPPPPPPPPTPIKLQQIDSQTPPPPPPPFLPLPVQIITPKAPAKYCDISKGEWVRDPEGPNYTNETCWMIQEHQNCMKYGRPDTDFLKWRWKPAGCEILRFDPARFLEMVRGKSMAFVGDSLARNQMQSLMCLLSKVEYPKDISESSDENFKRMFYAEYNFTIFVFWSPFLVKAQDSGPEPGMPYNFVKLYLDEVDTNWSSRIAGFDYVIISGGCWFNRPSLFYEKRRIVGCQYCDHLRNVRRLTYDYSNMKAFRTAFRAINRMKGYKATTFLRTMSPNHYENGVWNNGGDCVRTAPFRKDKARWMHSTDAEMYKSQAKEFAAAKREGRKKELEYKLLDTSGAMLMRPDGHPSRYGHWPDPGKAPGSNDCVHWCLPGPVDVWNDFLFHMMN